MFYNGVPGIWLLSLFDFENYIPEWGNVSDQELVGHVEQFEEKEKENSRFAALNDSELQENVADAEARGTKRNTKWVVKTFEGKYKKTLLNTLLNRAHLYPFNRHSPFIHQCYRYGKHERHDNPDGAEESGAGEDFLRRQSIAQENIG